MNWVFIVAAIQASMIFLFAAIGELIDQRSGILNVGLEGLMLVGALGAFIVAGETGNPWLGFAAGIASGAIFGLLHGFLSITLQADQVVSGMGIWIFALGLTTYIGNPLSGPLAEGGRMEAVIGGLTPMFFIGLAIVFMVWFILFKTRIGLEIRSIGEDPYVAAASGLNVEKIRYSCVIIGGALGGLSGAYLILVYNPIWSPNPTMGRGWIALAIVFFSMGKPRILILGAFLLGFLWHFALSSTEIIPWLPDLSYHFYRMIPFIATIIILIIISSKRISRRLGAARPAALGKPYIRNN